jgi:hypothetical protein
MKAVKVPDGLELKVPSYSGWEDELGFFFCGDNLTA